MLPHASQQSTPEPKIGFQGRKVKLSPLPANAKFRLPVDRRCWGHRTAIQLKSQPPKAIRWSRDWTKRH